MCLDTLLAGLDADLDLVFIDFNPNTFRMMAKGFQRSLSSWCVLYVFLCKLRASLCKLWVGVCVCVPSMPSTFRFKCLRTSMAPLMFVTPSVHLLLPLFPSFYNSYVSLGYTPTLHPPTLQARTLHHPQCSTQ